MTDKEKLEKVRAEIERLKDVDITEFPNTNWVKGRNFALVSLEVFIDSMQEEPKECMYSKDNYTDEDRKVLCDGCEEKCKYDKSDDFTKALAECIHNAQCNVVDPMVYAEIWKDELIKLSKCEEPVSEDLEEAARKYLKSLKDDCFIDSDTLLAFKAGAQWQKQKDESKVLTEEQCRKIRDDAFELGKDAMKQQMMAKAVDGYVGQTINGMLRALSDETFGDMGFTFGDKVKLIIIKAD